MNVNDHGAVVSITHDELVLDGPTFYDLPEGVSRQWAKQIFHAMNYGMGPATLANAFPKPDGVKFVPHPHPHIKEENVFKTRFGERKPKHGQRIYRLWIDGKFAGDFKTKRERREFIEMTERLREE